jgi:hypothetical protein
MTILPNIVTCDFSVNTSNYIIKDIPKFHPLEDEAEMIDFYRMIKRHCMEGMWVAGKWMPGELYTYANAWHIPMDKKGVSSKVYGRPLIRDIEGLKGYVYSVAFGFSGFELDDKFTCDALYEPSAVKENIELGLISEYDALKLK